MRLAPHYFDKIVSAGRFAVLQTARPYENQLIPTNNLQAQAVRGYSNDLDDSLSFSFYHSRLEQLSNSLIILYWFVDSDRIGLG